MSHNRVTFIFLVLSAMRSYKAAKGRNIIPKYDRKKRLRREIVCPSSRCDAPSMACGFILVLTHLHITSYPALNSKSVLICLLHRYSIPLVPSSPKNIGFRSPKFGRLLHSSTALCIPNFNEKMCELRLLECDMSPYCNSTSHCWYLRSTKLVSLCHVLH